MKEKLEKLAHMIEDEMKDVGYILLLVDHRAVAAATNMEDNQEIRDVVAEFMEGVNTGSTEIKVPSAFN